MKTSYLWALPFAFFFGVSSLGQNLDYNVEQFKEYWNCCQRKMSFILSLCIWVLSVPDMIYAPTEILFRHVLWVFWFRMIEIDDNHVKSVVLLSPWFNGIFNPFVYLYFELRYIRNKRDIHLSLRPEYWIVTLSLHDIVIAIIDIDMSSFYFAFLIFQNKDFVIQYINSLRLEWVGNLRLLLTQPFSLIKFKSTCMIHLALL